MAAKKLTDAQIMASMKKTAPWLYKMYTDPTFTDANRAVFMGWARAAAAGKPPTDKEKAAATYNWPMSQVWTTNQQQMYQLSTSNPGEYKARLAKAQSQVDALIKAKGLSVDNNTRTTAVNESFMQGWGVDDPRILQLLTDKGTINPADTSGEATTVLNQIKNIATNYNIPLPKDPAKLDAFIKGAIGPNADPNAFTEYAKNIAAAQYPFMADQILNQGVVPAHYFAPMATTIANTLDLPSSDAINWQDPKWSSLLTKTDSSGKVIPTNQSDVMKTIKLDPQYGYDHTTAGIADANNFGENLKSMFGF